MNDSSDVDLWWKRWITDRDAAARDGLIVHYSPLVKFVAGRVGAGLPGSVDPADLVSSGVFGLIDAVERFDPARGFKFETFAVPRIRGAVVDGLRVMDWVPRSVRSHARDVEGSLARLEGSLGRAPSDDELAADLHISSAELDRWMASIATTTVGPLDRALDAGSVPRPLHGDRPGSPEDAFEDADVRRLVRVEVRKLPDRERRVMALYYDEGLTLAEIGSVMGVTESRVSQIHTKAVLLLRSRLASAEIIER